MYLNIGKLILEDMMNWGRGLRRAFYCLIVWLYFRVLHYLHAKGFSPMCENILQIIGATGRVAALFRVKRYEAAPKKIVPPSQGVLGAYSGQ